MKPSIRGALPALAVLAVLFGGAVAGTARISMADDGAAWRQVLADGGLLESLLVSGAWTVVATILAAALALPAAALLRRSRLGRALFTLPVLLPHLLVAVVAVLWLAPGGLADRLLPAVAWDAVVRDRLGVGIVLVYVYKETPFLALLVAAAWSRRADDLAEAAATLGAGGLTRFRLVVWPEIRTPLVVGALVVAAFVFGAFEVPLVIGPSSPDPVAVYALEQIRTADPLGRPRAAAALLIATVVTVTFAAAAVGQWRSRGVQDA